MVYLKDLKTQWPWNLNNQDFSDKEIYTHRISIEDASKEWRVPLLPPMNGFAFVGMRVNVDGKKGDYTIAPRLVIGETKRGMFGLPWDNTLLLNGTWGPLGFPLTNKMIAICEDGLDLLISHSDVCWGNVEFVAQRFEDLLEDETGMSYVYLNHRTDKVEWVLTPDNILFKPHPMDGAVYAKSSKIIPSVWRLLDTNRNDWADTSISQNSVSLVVPLLVV